MKDAHVEEPLLPMYEISEFGMYMVSYFNLLHLK